MADTFNNGTDHNEWDSLGLKEYGDVSEKVSHCNERDDPAGGSAGDIFYIDPNPLPDGRMVIYNGSYSNSCSPGADWHATVYDLTDPDDKAQYEKDKAEHEAAPETDDDAPTFDDDGGDEEDEPDMWAIFVRKGNGEYRNDENDDSGTKKFREDLTQNFGNEALFDRLWEQYKHLSHDDRVAAVYEDFKEEYE